MNKEQKEEADLQPRSIRLPHSIWDALDDEAKRCKRSAVKHLEAMLTIYFDLEDVEIDQKRIGITKDMISQDSPQKEKYIARLKGDAPTT